MTDPAGRDALLAEVAQTSMRLAGLLQAYGRAVAREEALSPALLPLLAELPAPGEAALAMSDLARTLDLAPPTLSAQAESLAARGLLRREADPHDRRRVLVGLSPQGGELRERLTRRFQERQLGALQRLSDAELQGHRRALAELEASYGVD